MFADLVDSFLPPRTFVVVLHHVYLDESGTHDGAKIMSVAGYILEASQASRFARDWAKDLDKLGLPHAHMTDCVHGAGVHKGLSKDKCVESEKRLIEHVKRRTRFGFSVCVDPRSYDKIMSEDPLLPSAYSFCIIASVHSAAKWVHQKSPDSRLAFFFESGHGNQPEADQYMNDLASRPDKAEDYKYFSHTFLSKKHPSPLHAADMLAWQTCHYYERRLQGINKPRADLMALVRNYDTVSIYGERDIEKVREIVMGRAPEPSFPQSFSLGRI